MAVSCGDHDWYLVNGEGKLLWSERGSQELLRVRERALEVESEQKGAVGAASYCAERGVISMQSSS
jgi:hypothetical protein